MTDNDPEPIPEPLRQFFSEISRGIDRARPHILRGIQELRLFGADLHDRLTPVLEPALAWIEAHQDEIGAVLYAASQAASPPNWNGLTGKQMSKITSLTLRPDGTPVAWLPPVEVLGPMLDMDSLAQRDPIMLQHQAAIAATARELIAEVTISDLQELRAAVERAWDAWDSGHRQAAQALAAACVGEIVEGQNGLNLEKMGHLRAELDRAKRDENGKLDPATIGWSMREVATFTALRTALRNETGQKRLGVAGFNRHLTLHGVSAEQYTDSNGLRGLMIVTAGVRELQWLRDHPLVGPLIERRSALDVLSGKRTCKAPSGRTFGLVRVSGIRKVQCLTHFIWHARNPVGHGTRQGKTAGAAAVLVLRARGHEPGAHLCSLAYRTLRPRPRRRGNDSPRPDLP